ncbi:flavoprotein [Brevibacillus sp. NRS-1366]|uniref:flavoprotein n=1 Tax=Brevibacillus sp. NRS-1366 TaxID=3233899 RepID=UPI003D211087
MENNDGRIERLLIGATGSIGIVNLIPYIVEWKMNNWVKDVQVILTEMATSFIPPSTFAYFCNDVHVEMRDFSGGRIKHIELASWAQLFLIMPASVNIIGKAACGVADDLLSTSLVASSCPTVFVPNMNPIMYAKPTVQRNLHQLVKDGYYVIKPTRQKGFQASIGEVVDTLGIPQPHIIMQELLKILQLSQKVSEMK